MEWMLQRHPVLASRRLVPDGATLVHHAVEWDRPEFVVLALDHGVDPGIRDEQFDATALRWARHFGRDPQDQLCLRGGKKRGFSSMGYHVLITAADT
jgi:hypothetical protein